jgi:hypothetical protein
MRLNQDRLAIPLVMQPSQEERRDGCREFDDPRARFERGVPPDFHDPLLAGTYGHAGTAFFLIAPLSPWSASHTHTDPSPFSIVQALDQSEDRSVGLVRLFASRSPSPPFHSRSPKGPWL